MRSARHSGVQLMWMLPGVDLPDPADRAREVGGEDPGGQTEGGAVGLRDRRLPVVGLAHRDRRPEQLVLTERRRRVDVRDHRRGDHRAVPLAPGQDPRPRLRRRGDRLLDPLRLGRRR